MPYQSRGVHRIPRQEIPPHTTTPKLRNHLQLKSSLERCPASTAARDPAPSRIPQTSRDPRSPTAPAHRPHLQAPPAAIHYSAPGRREVQRRWGDPQRAAGEALEKGFLKGGAPASLTPAKRGENMLRSPTEPAGQSSESAPLLWVWLHCSNLGGGGTARNGVLVGARAGLLMVSDSRKRTLVNWLINALGHKCYIRLMWVSPT